MNGRRVMALVSLLVIGVLGHPGAAGAGQDSLGEEFLRIRDAISTVLADGPSIDRALRDTLLAQVRDLNRRALLDGKLEDTSFFPSLYLALLSCETIADEPDMVRVQDVLLPAAVNQTVLFSEVYLRTDSFVLRESDQVRSSVTHLDGCLADAISRLEAWVHDPSVSVRFRRFRHEELDNAAFWESLGRLKTQGVLLQAPDRLQPFMTVPAAPTRQPTPTPTLTPTPEPPAAAVSSEMSRPAQAPPEVPATAPGAGRGFAKVAKGLLNGSSMRVNTDNLPSLRLIVTGDDRLAKITPKTRIRVQINTEHGDEVSSRDSVKPVETSANSFELAVRPGGFLASRKVESGSALEVRLWIEDLDAQATYEVVVP